MVKIKILFLEDFLCYVIKEHIFPEICILKSKLLRNFKAQSEIQDYKLMFFMIFWIWPDKYIAWVWITMNKSWDKNLLSEGSNKIVHNCLLVESVFFHFLIISYLESIDPFRDHYALSWILTQNCGNIKFLSFYISLNLLNCSKFFLPLIEFSV